MINLDYSNATGGQVAATPSPTTSNAAEPARPGRQELAASGSDSPPTAVKEVETASTDEQIAEAVSHIASHIQSVSRSLQLSLDEVTGDVVVTVTDRDTGDVIRQVPSEEVVRLARYYAEHPVDPLKGLLMDSEG